MLIAVPSDAPGGLEAQISEHFGHCAAFTLVDIQEGQIEAVSVVENASHDEGGCMGPVRFLKSRGVDVLIAGGMGMRPLSGFQQVGIAVHFKEDAGDVRDAIELFVAGRCRAFGAAQTCSGGGDCGGHSHHETARESIIGPADIRPGRVVTLEYAIRDASGVLLDDSERSGPIRYLHGSGQLIPALQQAVAGLSPDSKVAVRLAAAEAFGERDEARVVQVPREQLPPDTGVGASVTGQDHQGRNFTFTVVRLDDVTADLDGNHPLAGKDLVFEITVHDVQAATADEIAHGHAH